MVKIEDIQQYGKEHLETVAASAATLQTGFQAIATAYGDYTKKSFEDTKSFVEKLSGVKSMDKAIEVQTEFANPHMRRSWRIQEDRRALYRSGQADLQAAGRHRREVYAGCHPLAAAPFFTKFKGPAIFAGLFTALERSDLETCAATSKQHSSRSAEGRDRGRLL